MYGSWLSGDGTVEGGPFAKVSILPVSLITTASAAQGKTSADEVPKILFATPQASAHQPAWWER